MTIPTFTWPGVLALAPGHSPFEIVRCAVDFGDTPPAAQLHVPGWAVSCEECGKTQHFDHVARERAERAARAAGWAVVVNRPAFGDPFGVGAGSGAAQRRDLCRTCAELELSGGRKG